MKTILRHAAYDTKSSCLLLDTKAIEDIEVYMSETGADVLSSLVCCNSSTYQSQQQFRFLPGHKNSILSIPKQIREMDSNERKKKKPMLEFKKLLTPIELKMSLLTRLNESVGKLGFESDSFDEVHFSDVPTMIINNQLTAKCTVQCFQCDVTVTALYKGYWNTSNILRHVKIHRSSDGIVRSPEELSDSNGNANVASSQTDIDSTLLDKINSGKINHGIFI